MNPMLNIAIRAARKAGNVIAKGYERRDALQTTLKSTNDYVTNIDKASEEAIIEVIRKSYPDHTIITEESGALEGKDSDIQWVINPLDGTTNFVKGLPHFSVSIAIRVKGRTEVGVSTILSVTNYSPQYVVKALKLMTCVYALKINAT